MTTPQNLWQRVRRKPFMPFRLHLSSGEAYDVRHPEMIAVSRSRIVISLHEKGQRDEELPARQVLVSPLHVRSAEDLPVEAAA